MLPSNMTASTNMTFIALDDHNRGRSGNLGINHTVDTIVKRLSETAGELRSPLDLVASALRSLRDNDQLSNLQREELCKVGLAQIERMNQSINAMSVFESLRANPLSVRRQSISVSDIRTNIEKAMSPWSLSNHLEILWDVPAPSSVAFVDVELITRLVSGIVSHTIRTANEGDTILLSVRPSENRDSITWSVIDRGEGFTAAEMGRFRKLDQSSSNANASMAFAKCRHLAALHFSSLCIRSRKGMGTEIYFETPHATPKSITQCWLCWRTSELAEADELSKHRRSRLQDSHRSIRMDPPVMAAELRHEQIAPRHAKHATLGVLSLGETASRAMADQFDSYFQSELGYYDFAFRAGSHRWVWVVDADVSETQKKLHHISNLTEAESAQLAIRWTVLSTLDLTQRRTAITLSDLMVRESLDASTPVSVYDSNQVRLGTAPIEPTVIASERLDEDLKRLSERIRRQNSNLREQSNKLRP